jgi:purine-binding chemotaxis protein CheW
MDGARQQSYVVFRVDERWYGVPLEAVERVVRMAAITPAPQAPEVVLGVVDIQGVVVPVLDLRRRLELPDRTPSLDDRILVVRSGGQWAAFIVDEVTGLMRPEASQLTAARDISVGMECLSGVARTGSGMVLLLDLERLVDFGAGVNAAGGTR